MTLTSLCVSSACRMTPKLGMLAPASGQLGPRRPARAPRLRGAHQRRRRDRAQRRRLIAGHEAAAGGGHAVDRGGAAHAVAGAVPGDAQVRLAIDRHVEDDGFDIDLPARQIELRHQIVDHLEVRPAGEHDDRVRRRIGADAHLASERQRAGGRVARRCGGGAAARRDAHALQRLGDVVGVGVRQIDDVHRVGGGVLQGVEPLTQAGHQREAGGVADHDDEVRAVDGNQVADAVVRRGDHGLGVALLRLVPAGAEQFAERADELGGLQRVGAQRVVAVAGLRGVERAGQ